MAYPIKKFRETLRGAPVLNGTQSSLKNILKTVLFDGFGETTILAMTVTDGICTVTTKANESFSSGYIVTVDGASIPLLNGEQLVETGTANTFTFKTTAANGPVTGTIKVKYAPVGGWKIWAENANVLVLQSMDPDSSGAYFRIDDTAALYTVAVAYENMLDINTGENPFPAPSTNSHYWGKSAAASTAARNWLIYASQTCVYVFTQPYKTTIDNTSVAFQTNAFGDYVHVRAGYKRKAFMFGQIDTNTAIGSNHSTIAYNINSGTGRNLSIMDTMETGLRQPSWPGRMLNWSINSNLISGTTTTTLAYIYNWPGVFNKKMRLSKIYIWDNNLREEVGYIPGIQYILNTTPGTIARDTSLYGTDALLNRRLDIINIGESGGIVGGNMLIDFTGPW